MRRILCFFRHKWRVVTPVTRTPLLGRSNKEIMSKWGGIEECARCGMVK